MQRFVPFFFLFFLLLACNQVDRVLGKDEPTEAGSYSYACLDSSVAGNQTGRRIEKATKALRDLTVSRKAITDEVQNEYGEAFHRDMVQNGGLKLIQNPALEQKLNQMTQQLLAKRTKPSGIRYVTYAVDDPAINAFTFGGRIYVTTGMLGKCRGNDALLYAIIGHEIGHSETGHIKTTIQDMAFTERVFGQGGATVFELKKLLTASFNQRNELEADYYGINLTNALGLDLCTAVSFWREMASKENSYNRLEDFFRTHPFSEARAGCLAQHIRTNFGKDCGGIDRQQSHPEVTR